MSIRWIGNDDKILSTLTTVFPIPQHMKIVFFMSLLYSVYVPWFSSSVWTMNRFYVFFVYIPFHILETRTKQMKKRMNERKNKKISNLSIIKEFVSISIIIRMNGQTHLNPIEVSNIFVVVVIQNRPFLRWQFVSN